MPPPPGHDILRGTLDLLILKALALEPQHGWALSQRIQQLSSDALRIGQGSLYPALQRLEYRGWIDGAWRPLSPNRRARFYALTASGKRALSAETAKWREYVATVELILQT